MTALPADTQALMERRARVLGPAYRLFYETPLHPVRGEGVWLHDADGKRYLDAYNNVASVGHCHPHVVEAIARQASILNTHTRYLHEGVLDYAERLLATMPSELAHAMFTCTGSEANDLAMRIARSHTKADGLIITRFAYHGVTSAIAAASPSLGKFVQLGDNVRTVSPSRTNLPSDGEASAIDAVTPWYAKRVTINPSALVWARAMRIARSLASLPVQVNIACASSDGSVASSRSA